MDFLKAAGFGALFTVTFVVAASFQITMTILGLGLALLSPGLFKMNGAPAANPIQAIGVVIFLGVFMLVLNAAVSAAGSGLWLAIGRMLPQSKRAVS
jgi:hypothetical protein